MSGLDEPEHFLEVSALHPRLLESGARRELQAHWHMRGHVRIDEVLAPGLAAQLGELLGRVPFAPLVDDQPRALRFCCVMELPAAPEARHSGCLYRLVRFLGRDLPELVGAVTGLPCAASRDPRCIVAEALRKGSYRDGFAPGMHALLGLCAARWPVHWGGYLELSLPEPGGNEQLAPGWDTLDLFGAERQARIALLREHVPGFLVGSALRTESPSCST